MKFIKKNKFTILVISLFVILVIGLAIIKNIFFPNAGQPVYGDRLKGIEDVKIEESRYDDLEKKLKKEEAVDEVSTNLSGKTINIIITVKDNTSIKDAKSIGAKVLEEFKEEELAFYDI